MSKQELVVCLALGAGALAAWIDVRCPKLVPEGTGPRFAHAGAAFVASAVAPAVMQALFALATSVPVQLVALFAVFVPALVYAFLAAIWLLRALRAALPR